MNNLTKQLANLYEPKWNELKQQLVNVKKLGTESSMRQVPYRWGSPAPIGCLPTLTNRWRLPLN